LAAAPSPEQIAQLLRADAAAPLESDDAVRKAVRDLLRNGRYKPTGRAKPSAEYLLRAVSEGKLGPLHLINPAVDACNVVSFHSGLPISVVDLARTKPPLHVRLAPVGSSYVFNASGQTIDVGDLLCLHDADGPCANPVKDAERTKTGATTLQTLSLIWGTHDLPDRATTATAWYRSLLEPLGATTELIAVEATREHSRSTPSHRS